MSLFPGIVLGLAVLLPPLGHRCLASDIGAISRCIETEKTDFGNSSITAQVKVTLLYHGSTSGIGTKVKTKNGAVTVSGKSKNAAEKGLVTKLASDVIGLKKASNRMTVVWSK